MGPRECTRSGAAAPRWTLCSRISMAWNGDQHDASTCEPATGGGRPPWATRPPAPRPDSPTDRNHQSFCFLRVRLDRFLQAHKSREENPPILICHPRATVLGESAREKSAERGTIPRRGSHGTAPGETRAGERRGKRISQRTHARPTFVHLSDDEYTHIDVVVTKDEIACRRGREQRTAHEKRRSQEAGRAGEASHRCRHGVP